MELCKAAAQAAVDVMTDEQSVGVLTFNDKFDWDVTLRNVGKNRDAIRKKIAAIEPGGHTLIYPGGRAGLSRAARTPRRAPSTSSCCPTAARIPDDYEGARQEDGRGAASRCRRSRSGRRPTPSCCTNIAKWGKGRSYAVADAKEVPQIFVKEAKNAATPGVRREGDQAGREDAGVSSPASTSRACRSCKGRTATVLKDAALELLATDDGDPLLAFWPIGLGRTAVFASDVKDRWAADWVRWRGYGPFFAVVVRALERQRCAAAGARGHARPGARPTAHDRRRDRSARRQRPVPEPAQPGRAGRVRAADGPRAPALAVVTRQVAPGRYEATVIADATQPLTISLDGADARTSARASTAAPSSRPGGEYRFRAPDEALLRSIARRRAAPGIRRPPRSPTAPATAAPPAARCGRALIALALGLWFVDLLLRRVRVFEPSSLKRSE